MDSELLLRISEILAVNFFEYYSECLEEAGAGCRGVFFAPRRTVARQGSVTHSALWNETEAGEMAKAEPCEAERQKNF